MNFNDENKKFIFLPVHWIPEEPKELTAIVKKHNQIVGYEIGDEFFSKEKALLMAQEGKILNIGVGAKSDLTQYLCKHPERIDVDEMDIEVIED